MLPQVIYGEDDRHEPYQLNETRWQEFASSTALLIYRRYVRKIEGDDNNYQLVTETAGKRFGLCPNERFWKQPSAVSPSNCSGFLVGKDLLVSAAHCFLDAGACKTTAVVFDYTYHSHDDDPTRVPQSSIYFCKKILERVYEIGTGLDFAVVRLDRAVQGRKPLPLSTKGKVAPGDRMAVIGHPLSLPTKISHGTVRSVSDQNFVINADLWDGNSGSPVFDVHTGIVNGLVTRGEKDFVVDRDGGCRTAHVCAPDGCDGEQVVRATKFAEYAMRHL